MVLGSNEIEVDVPQTDSLTNLLKASGATLSAVKANKLLMALGVLEEKQRPSTKDPSVMKKYKVLTEQGLKYGVNKENINTPGQTSPYYFVDGFDGLLVLIQKQVDLEK